MKLELGKYYKSRAGDVYGPLEVNRDGLLQQFPFCCDGDSWTEIGGFRSVGIHACDLVEEVEAPTAEPAPTHPLESVLYATQAEPSAALPTLHTVDPFEAIKWAQDALEHRGMSLDWTVSRLCVGSGKVAP